MKIFHAFLFIPTPVTTLNMNGRYFRTVSLFAA